MTAHRVGYEISSGSGTAPICSSTANCSRVFHSSTTCSPAGDKVDVRGAEHHVPASRNNSLPPRGKASPFSQVRAPGGPAGRHLIALGQLILDLEDYVRACIEERLQNRLYGLDAARRWLAGEVGDVFGREDLLNDAYVPRAHAVQVRTAHDGLVAFEGLLLFG
jgi:hypothetical protein